MEEYLRRLPILSQLAPAALDVCKHAVADKIQEHDRSVECREKLKIWKLSQMAKSEKTKNSQNLGVQIFFLWKHFSEIEDLKNFEKN